MNIKRFTLVDLIIGMLLGIATGMLITIAIDDFLDWQFPDDIGSESADYQQEQWSNGLRVTNLKLHPDTYNLPSDCGHDGEELIDVDGNGTMRWCPQEILKYWVRKTSVSHQQLLSDESGNLSWKTIEPQGDNEHVAGKASM